MNVTENFSNVGVSDDFNQIPFTYQESVVFTVVLTVFGLFGLFANFVTFFVIVRTAKLRENAFNVFLASLCVSDFLSSINSPFVLYQKIWGFQYFDLPEILCKLHVAIDVWTSVTTIQHILVFALLRVISIKFPVAFKKLLPLHSKVAVFCIWLETAVVVFVPYAIWPGLKQDTGWYSCTMSSLWMFEVKKYMTYGFPFLFYAPMVMIVLMNLTIAAMLIHMQISRNKNRLNISPNARGFVGKAEKSRRRKEKMAVVQLVLVMSSFFLGYIPDVGYRLYIINIRLQLGTSKLSSMHLIWLLGTLSYTLLRLSECLNPVLYNLASSRMRGVTIEFLSCCKNRLSRSTNPQEPAIGRSTKDSSCDISSHTKVKSTGKTAFEV